MNIITALGNQSLNLELKKNELFNVISTDIQYQEALIEILKKRNDCNILIISELLYGEKNIKELIINILKINPKIKIIIFLEKENDELSAFLISIGIYKIFINNQINFEELNKAIEEIYLPNNYIENNSLIKIEKNNRKIIFNKLNIIKNKIMSKINNIKLKINKEKINNKIIIAVAGISGSGKSTYSALIGEYLKYKKIKTIIIDFNIFDNSINTIFGVKKYPKNINTQNKINDINNLIIKINNYLSLICGMDLFFTEENKIDENKINIIFNLLKEKYDVIIIDLSSDTYLKYCKLLLNKSDKILFLLNPNLIEIKKSIKLIKIYTEYWNIEKNKFNLILNKLNINSVDDKIIKCIFSEYKILEKFNYSNYYNFIFNNNFKNILINKTLKNKLNRIIIKLIN